MGGWWSGPPRRWLGTVEGARSLDVLRFSRNGMISTPGGVWSWRWNDAEDGQETTSIGIATVKLGDALALRLVYRHTPEEGSPIDRDDLVMIERTACRYGGTRPWFRCPACERRSRFLYLSRGLFICRKCARLTYWTRRIHRHGGSESVWIDARIERLQGCLARARSEGKRAHIEARLARLEGRQNAIWASLLGRLCSS